VGILGVSFLLAALLWWAAPTVIAVLYGPAFGDSAQVLRWLAPLVMLYVANPFLSAVLMSRRLSIAIGAASLVNLGIALACYPFAIAAFGIAGAALTSVLVELIGLLHMVAWLLATDRRSP
jgi:O-antigen/teichoic acid export membrane protein